jgi:hypothetical protein
VYNLPEVLGPLGEELGVGTRRSPIRQRRRFRASEVLGFKRASNLLGGGLLHRVMDSRQNCAADAPRLREGLGAGPLLLRPWIRPLPDQILGETEIILNFSPLCLSQLVVVLCDQRQILVSFRVFSDRKFVTDCWQPVLLRLACGAGSVNRDLRFAAQVVARVPGHRCGTGCETHSSTAVDADGKEDQNSQS